MSITVKDCLNLPSLHYSKLVAGKDGLDKIVSSVSVSEIPETSSDIKVFNPNELTISAFYNIKDDSQIQCQVLKTLSEVGVVALVIFYLGSIVKKLPKELLELADELSFPLIVMDPKTDQIKYSDVITDVMTAIINDQNNAIGFVDSTKTRLQQVPKSKRNMDNLLKIISSSYKCNLLLYNNIGVYFPSVYRPSYGVFDDKYYLNEFRNYTFGYACKEINHHGNNFYLYKYDFMYQGNSWMTMYASCTSNLLNENILKDICICINYFTDLWGYTLDFQLKQTAITLILKSTKTIAEKFLSAISVIPEKISNLIIFSGPDIDLHKFKGKISIVFDSFNKFNISDIIDNKLVILTSLTISDKHDASLVQELETITYDSALSTCFFLDGNKQTISSLKTAYTYYCSNAEAMNKIFIHRKYHDMHDVMFAQEVITLSQKNTARKMYIQSLINTLQGDSDNLLETLAVYLIDCDSKLNMTAKTLFLHRNTVSYRLNKIKRLTNADFTIMPATYDYYLAAALTRYIN